MTCGVSCARMMLIIFNVFFWISGLAILAIGIWMLVDDTIVDLLDFVNVGEDDNMLEYAAYILIGVGSFAIIVGFCGCCGAIKKSKCLLGLYIFFLFIVMAGELGAGILAVVYRDDVEDELKERLETELGDLGEDHAYITRADGTGDWQFNGFGQLLSLAQNELECCGINDASDYTNADFGVKVIEGDGAGPWELLPSCCKEINDGKSKGDLQEDPNDFVDSIEDYITGFSAAGTCETYETGCFEEAKDWFNEKAYVIIGIGIGVACLEIFGFIFAICLCRNVEE